MSSVSGTPASVSDIRASSHLHQPQAFEKLAIILVPHQFQLYLKSFHINSVKFNQNNQIGLQENKTKVGKICKT